MATHFSWCSCRRGARCLGTGHQNLTLLGTWCLVARARRLLSTLDMCGRVSPPGPEDFQVVPSETVCTGRAERPTPQLSGPGSGHHVSPMAGLGQVTAWTETVEIPLRTLCCPLVGSRGWGEVQQHLWCR